MDQSQPQKSRTMRLSTDTFLHVEHGIYIALGVVLAVTAILAMGTAVYALGAAVLQLNGGTALLDIIDRLLFVLMLAEILHTVRVSIQSGALTPEPFLVVGLIASIRRVLVITLESSQATPGKGAEVGHDAIFHASMIELGVLGGLILVMVISIYLIRRSGKHDGPVGSSMS